MVTSPDWRPRITCRGGQEPVPKKQKTLPVSRERLKSLIGGTHVLGLTAQRQ